MSDKNTVRIGDIEVPRKPERDTVAVQLKPPLSVQVRSYAVKAGVSVNALVRAMVEDCMKRMDGKTPAPPAAAKPEAKSKQ